jgi:ubiquinone/menaquinone biosynthesis C-methylase UbiE
VNKECGKELEEAYPCERIVTTAERGAMHNREYATYGEKIAEIYDELVLVPEDAEYAASFLSELAGSGVAAKALELGIGTGRIALPLAQTGIEVHGIDASESMVKKLRAKPGGTNISVNIGTFADLRLEERFSLVYVVFNTFFGLLSQEEQVRCFENAARHLGDGGAFVIEAFVPDMSRYDKDQRVEVHHLGGDHVILGAATHDPLAQRISASHLVISEGGIQLYPVELRYAWPSELDLMARLAGLELHKRWGGWHREPLTKASDKHVSVYVRG